MVLFSWFSIGCSKGLFFPECLQKLFSDQVSQVNQTHLLDLEENQCGKGDSDERLYIFIDLVVGDVLETKASNPSQILPSFHTRSCSWAARCFSSNSAMSRVHRHVASLVLEGRPRARQQGGKGNVHMLLCNNMHALAGIDTGRKTKKLKKR